MTKHVETVLDSSRRSLDGGEALLVSSAETPTVDATQSAAPTPSRTPAQGSRRLVFSTPISTPNPPVSSIRKIPRTPASGIKVGNGEEMCAVCYSPLERERSGKRWDFFGEAGEKEAGASGEDGKGDDELGTSGDANETDGKENQTTEVDPKCVLFTTTCNHVFHRCCLVRCREQDFSTCPMCRAALPSGLTPEHVREKRAAKRLVDQANAQQNAIVGAAARAREAVRAQYVRRMVNRPAGLGLSDRVPPAIEEEGSNAENNPSSPMGTMPPWMSPPRGRRVGSAPVTPARTNSLPTETNSQITSPFVTAAEELRNRFDVSNVAAAAFATASAPSTPARTRSLVDDLITENERGPGTISSLISDATRGPGNAGTLDGLLLAEQDALAGRRAAVLETDDEPCVETTVASVAAALGALAGDLGGRNSGGDTTFTARPPFQSATALLENFALSSATVHDALVAHGTASAPATPNVHRPAVAAAIAAAEAAASEGDELRGERAQRVLRRLAAD